MDVLVLGQVARDLALRLDRLPDTGTSGPVHERREMLGGKGANQAVAMAQLGLAPELLGVVGDDRYGGPLLDQAVRDGVDTACVVRREGTRSALIVDVVTGDGGWRYLEDLPEDTLVTRADVEAAADAVAGVDVVVLQLQQPMPAVRAAARIATGTVVLDGAPPDHDRGVLLAAADVLRADAHEAQLWAGRTLRGAADALVAARELVGAGLGLVVLGAGAEGNVAAWPEGELVLPFGDDPVVDTTGGGDAFTAALVAGLDDGPEEAARWGAAAATLTVGHLGGRPALSLDAVRDRALSPSR